MLDGAAVVFAECGYAKATTNRIAKEAGVHVPSVYQYFPNKDALLAEIWDRHVDALIGALQGMLSSPAEAPVPETARLYITLVLEMHAAAPDLLSVLYQEGPRLPGVRSLRDEAAALLVPYLEHHRALLRPGSIDVAAFVLASAVEGVARQAVVPPAPSIEALTDEVVALVTSYLGISDV